MNTPPIPPDRNTHIQHMQKTASEMVRIDLELDPEVYRGLEELARERDCTVDDILREIAREESKRA